MKRWTWNKKERRNEARTLLILPRNDSMKGVVLGGVVRKDGRGEGEEETAYTLGIEISGMDPSIPVDVGSVRDKWNEGRYPRCFSRFPESIGRSIDRSHFPSRILYPLFPSLLPLLFLFSSFITRTKGKDESTSSPVDVRAYLVVSVHTRISFSPLRPLCDLRSS